MTPGVVFSPGPGDGVDLNRNWDHNWDGDPSVDPASRNYKGPHPMSEPEVQAMAALIRREMPVLVVDFHSPGKITPPNRIFWPWLEKGTGKLGPDAEVYHAIAAEMAARTETEDDGVFYDGDGYGFDTLPKEQNWVYVKTGICALLVEISKRFWWEGPIVDVIAERVATGSFSLFARALHGPGIAGRVTDAETGHPVVAEVRVEGMHDARIGPRSTEERHGAYWRFLPPREAKVTVLADGYESITRRIRVGEDGWTTLDFSLRRDR